MVCFGSADSQQVLMMLLFPSPVLQLQAHLTFYTRAGSQLSKLSYPLSRLSSLPQSKLSATPHVAALAAAFGFIITYVFSL